MPTEFVKSQLMFTARYFDTDTSTLTTHNLYLTEFCH